MEGGIGFPITTIAQLGSTIFADIRSSRDLGHAPPIAQFNMIEDNKSPISCTFPHHLNNTCDTIRSALLQTNSTLMSLTLSHCLGASASE
eukprot:4631696-Pyramimonas_sp.AAC.1